MGLQLPEPAHTLERQQRHTGSLPRVALDMHGVPEFQRRVYAITASDTPDCHVIRRVCSRVTSFVFNE